MNSQPSTVPSATPATVPPAASLPANTHFDLVKDLPAVLNDNVLDGFYMPKYDAGHLSARSIDPKNLPELISQGRVYTANPGADGLFSWWKPEEMIPLSWLLLSAMDAESKAKSEAQKPPVLEETGATPGEPLKRGRGRPRKHPYPVKDPAAPKRGRGRPKITLKNPLMHIIPNTKPPKLHFWGKFNQPTDGTPLDTAKVLDFLDTSARGTPEEPKPKANLRPWFQLTVLHDADCNLFLVRNKPAATVVFPSRKLKTNATPSTR